MTVFNLTPSIDLRLHLHMRAFCRFVHAQMAVDQADRDEEAFARQNGALERSELVLVVAVNDSPEGLDGMVRVTGLEEVGERFDVDRVGLVDVVNQRLPMLFL